MKNAKIKTYETTINGRKRRVTIPDYKDATIETIARDTLGIETLETRKSDSLDFHEVSVWSLRDALAAAFEAGRQTSR